MRKSWETGGAVLLWMLPLTVAAGVLPDPTRIPVEIRAPAAGRSASPNRGLQSIIIAPGRRAAIIDGKTVEQGGKYGNARLVQVNEDSVVLRGSDGKRVLTLFPGVKIRKEMAKPLFKLPAGKPETNKKTARDAAPREEK